MALFTYVLKKLYSLAAVGACAAGRQPVDFFKLRKERSCDGFLRKSFFCGVTKDVFEIFLQGVKNYEIF